MFYYDYLQVLWAYSHLTSTHPTTKWSPWHVKPPWKWQRQQQGHKAAAGLETWHVLSPWCFFFFFHFSFFIFLILILNGLSTMTTEEKKKAQTMVYSTSFGPQHILQLPKQQQQQSTTMRRAQGTLCLKLPWTGTCTMIYLPGPWSTYNKLILDLV